MKKNIAVYAGTFDPVTNGHLDIIERASRMFDTLYVTICINPNKQGLFSIDERKELLKAACQQFDNVIIDSSDKLSVEYAKDVGSRIIAVSYTHLTKYLAGHGNVMGGVIVDSGNFKWKDNPRYPLFNMPDKAYHDIVYADLGAGAFCTKAVAKTLRDLGGCMSPFNAYMTLLGLETLSLRMKKHVENARLLAKFLNECDDVEWVSYAELPDSPNYELAKKYFPNGFGGLYTFGVKGGVAGGKTVINNIKLFIHVTNFADSRSLLTHPASTTHAQMSEEERIAGGVKQETIRMSVGLEDVEDLIADLKQAFAKI